MNDDDKTMGCFITVLALVSLPLLLGGCFIGSKVKVSDGYRDVVVQKFSNRGVVFPTWEGEGLVDGRLKVVDGRGGSVVFAFTVDDPAVVEQIQALPSNATVRLHYRQSLTTWHPSGDTSYRVTKAEAAK